jgi:hypothetical protein
MATIAQKVTNGVHALSQKNGASTTVTAQSDYSTQQEAQDLLLNGIIRNPLMKGLPAELEALSKHVRFEGSPTPSIPINWRFSESIS